MSKEQETPILLGKPTRGENPKESFLYNARSLNTIPSKGDTSHSCRSSSLMNDQTIQG